MKIVKASPKRRAIKWAPNPYTRTAEKRKNVPVTVITWQKHKQS